MYSTESEVVVHVVNNRYDCMQGTVKPVQDKTLSIQVSEEMMGQLLTISYYTPETTPVTLEQDQTFHGNMVTVTLPDIHIWGNIHIWGIIHITS